MAMKIHNLGCPLVMPLSLTPLQLIRPRNSASENARASSPAPFGAKMAGKPQAHAFTVNYTTVFMFLSFTTPSFMYCHSLVGWYAGKPRLAAGDRFVADSVVCVAFLPFGIVYSLVNDCP